MNIEPTSLLKDAKLCRTKIDWEKWYEQHSGTINAGISAKVLREIVKCLKSDSLSLNYGVDIWLVLLKACNTNWDLETALSIVDYTQSISDPKLLLQSVGVLIDKGLPAEARKVAHRALRHTNLEIAARLQFEMLVCRTFADEGKRQLADRQSKKVANTANHVGIGPEIRAEIFAQLGRCYFFLGRYQHAGKYFCDSFTEFTAVKNWHESARSAYNAGSAYLSAGDKWAGRAFELIEECRRICEHHNFVGPLSHVEAFYGHWDYWHGNFPGARDHYRRAYQYIPQEEGSFRTLHILSMLTLIYLRTGQFVAAKNFGEKTLTLAKEDRSSRFKTRYQSLEAEILWENGKLRESQHLLRSSLLAMRSNGINTLEELSILSRYYLQCSILGEPSEIPALLISESLKKNSGDWIEHLHARACLELSDKNDAFAEADFEDCLNLARSYGDKYHSALSCLGLFKVALFRDDLPLASKRLQEFEIGMGCLADTPYRAHIYIARSAINYRRGDFEGAMSQLALANKLSVTGFCDRLCLETWILNSQGKTLRTLSGEERQVVRVITKSYFHPSLKVLEEGRFLVSGHYEVCLADHPSLKAVLLDLLAQPQRSTTYERIQQEVWEQGLSNHGWKQKLHNALHRLRQNFTQTMMPVVFSDDKVRFESCIEALIPSSSKKKIKQSGADFSTQIIKILRYGPLSSVDLANKLDVSAATAKRVLKLLIDAKKVTAQKEGREVRYESQVGPG